MKNYNHILHKATTLLLTAAAALSLCLLTGCNREDLPETGKYNVSVQLDTKTIDPSEVGSIVIYAFADTDGSRNKKLVGYLNEKVSDTDTDGIFNMTLWSRGEDGYVDFYVLLNYDSEEFKICDTNGVDVKFNAQTYSPDDIQSWTVLRRTPGNVPSDERAWKVPMSNLEEKTQPTGGSPEPNRRFYLEDIKGWQVIPIEVTRAVSKVEVWFWSNDHLTGGNQPYYYYSITSQTITDPIAETANIFSNDAHNSAGTATTITNTKRYDAHSTDGRTNVGLSYDEYFPQYVENTYFYSSDYFKLIWEQYILPNTLFGGDELGQGSTGCTALLVNYEYNEQKYENTGSDWRPSYDWIWPTPSKRSTLVYLPKSPRNTKVVVWCGLGKDVDPSFNYLVVEWDETVTIEVPEFD